MRWERLQKIEGVTRPIRVCPCTELHRRPPGTAFGGKGDRWLLASGQGCCLAQPRVLCGMWAQGSQIFLFIFHEVVTSVTYSYVISSDL